MPGRVNLIRPDGKVVSASASDAQLLLTLGYRYEAPEENLQRITLEQRKRDYSTPSQQVLAGLEGLASGATLGLADLAMADDATRARAEFNPTTRFLGEVTGQVLPAILTMGGSTAAQGGGVLSKLAMATPAGALSKGAASVAAKRLGTGLAANVAGGMVEGGVAGVGGALTRASLSGDPVTVEEMLAGGGLGMMFGAGAGALAHGMSSMGARAKAFAEAGGPDASFARQLDDLPPDRVARDHVEEGLGAPPPGFEPPAPARPRVGPKASPEDFETTVNAAVPQKHWDTFQVSIDDAATKSQALVDHMNAAHGMDAASVRKAMKAYGDDIMNQAMLSSVPSVAPAVRKLRAQYRKLMEAMGDNYVSQAAKGYREAADELASLSGVTPDPRLKEIVDGPAFSASKESSKYVEQVADFARAVKTARMYVPGTPAEFVRMHGANAEKFRAAVEHIQASGLKEAAPFQQQLNDSIDQLVQASGISVQGKSALERLEALKEALGNAARQSSNTWDAAVPKTKAAAPEAPAPNLAADDVPEPPDEAVPRKGQTWGDYMQRRVRWEAAHRLSAAVLGQTTQASGPKLLKYGVTAAFLGLRGLATTAIKDAARKVAGIAVAQKAVRTAGPRAWALWQSADGHLTEEKDLREAFKARTQELRELATAGRDRLFAFAQELSAAGHPDFGYALYQAAARAQDTIIQRLPKDPPGTRWGTEYLWDAPAEQIEVFAQEYAAAFMPTAFLRELADDPEGVHPSAVQTLREAWPNVYNDFRAQALVQLGLTGTKGMDRSRLQALSVILDVPLDPTMDPQFVAAQQAMYMEPPPQPKQGGGPTGNPGRPAGADATAAQRSLR